MTFNPQCPNITTMNMKYKINDKVEFAGQTGTVKSAFEAWCKNCYVVEFFKPVGKFDKGAAWPMQLSELIYVAVLSEEYLKKIDYIKDLNAKDTYKQKSTGNVYRVCFYDGRYILSGYLGNFSHCYADKPRTKEEMISYLNSLDLEKVVVAEFC